MMKWISHVVVCVVLANASCATPSGSADKAGSQAALDAPRTVVIVSLDGFRHDYPALARTRTFDRLTSEGARAMRLLPVFPSQTFPAHASLATGVYPDKHGIINNEFRDRKRGLFNKEADVSWYDAVPIWIHAQRSGVPATVLEWPVGHGSYDGVEPEYSQPFTRGISDSERVDRIIDRIDRARSSAQSQLIIAYLEGCDAVGHTKGPMAPEIRACVDRYADELGRIMGAMDRADGGAATLIVVSDHGMTKTEGEINPLRALTQVGIPAESISTGTVANIYAADATVRERAYRVTSYLSPSTVYRRESIPEELHYNHPRRTGDLVFVAANGWVINPHTAEVVGPPTHAGHHGHGPTNPDMSGILFLWGDGVKPGVKADAVLALDLFPTVCALLGLPVPSHLDGHVLRGFLASGE